MDRLQYIKEYERCLSIHKYLQNLNYTGDLNIKGLVLYVQCKMRIRELKSLINKV